MTERYSGNNERPESEKVDLCFCLGCQSDLVQPMKWAQEDSGKWQLEVACPECYTVTEGTFSDSVAYKLSDVMEDRTSHLLDVIVNAEVEDFSWALNAGLITPEDF